MAVTYDNDEAGSPWRVVLYVDQGTSPAAETALRAIFAGRAGGNIRFTAEIGETVAVRKAMILSPGRLTVRATRAAVPFMASD